MKTKLLNDLSLVSLGLFAYMALGLPILRGDVSTSGLEETREFSDEGVDNIIRYTDDTDPTNDHRITAGDVDDIEDLLGSDLGDADSVPDINLSIVEAGQNVEISFDTVSGVLYRIHERSDLTSRVRDWNVLAGPFAGDNTRQTRPAPKLEDICFYGVSFELAPLP